VALPVEVRFRNYETAAEFTERFDDQLALQLTPDSTQTFWPGERVKLTALWQAQRLLSTAYLVSIRVLDQDFAVAGARDNTLGDRYPNVLWAPGEVVPETYFIPLDPNAPPGLYQLEFSLVEILDETNYRFLPIHLADETSVDHLYPMTIRMLDPAQAQFAPTQPTNFKIGSAINLIGFDLERPAEKVVDVALYWQTEAKPAADYTVFTQLIGPDGQVWGQQDNPPQAGRYPTGHWSASDRVVDRYHLTLREGAPVGQYRLLVGMYKPSIGTRLPVWDATGQPGPDNAILLSTIDVE
jgi:hypothetical protein